MGKLSEASKEKGHMQLTKILVDVKDASFLSYTIWNHLDSALAISASGDPQGVERQLQNAMDHCELEKK